jgi:hypothetical protein
VGELKSLTDPDGRTVNYDFDDAGRLTNVFGVGYNVSQLANDFQYRAWGAPKHYNVGFSWSDGTPAGLTPTNLSYNSRMQLTRFTLTHPTVGASPIYDSEYQYYSDGRPQFISDKRAWSIQQGWPPTENMHQFDRAYSYDQAARLTQASTGNEARGGTIADGPYKETYQYDNWNNMTNRVNRIWSKPLDSFNDLYVNNRNQSAGHSYDADGNDLGQGSFDAAGRKVTFSTYMFLYPPGGGDPQWYSAQGHATYDGDGSLVEEQDVQSPQFTRTDYFIRSSVLGGKEILMVKDEPYNGQGVVTRLVSIYANGETIARSTNGNVRFEHSEPITGRRTDVEPDPLGQEVGTYDPGPDNPGDVGEYPEPHEFGNGEDPANGCTLDGITIDCPTLSRFMNMGATAQDYLVHDRHGWHPEQYPIEPLGLGMFVTERPYFQDINDNEGPGRVYDTEEVLLAPQSSYIGSSADCTIQVNFQNRLSRRTPRFTTGPDHTKLGEFSGTKKIDNETWSVYGFRFEVTGHVNSGSIGQIGDPRVSTSIRIGSGGWQIGQWKYPSPTNNRNGISRPGAGRTTDDSPRYARGPDQNVSVRGRDFAWNDEPGFNGTPDDPVQSADFTTNFMVYAQNGDKRCEVSFHIVGSFRNGAWHATIGPGLLP